MSGDGYGDVVAVLDGGAGDSFAEAGVEVVQFDAIGQDEFVPLWEGFFPRDFHESFTEEHAVGDR